MGGCRSRANYRAIRFIDLDPEFGVPPFLVFFFLGGGNSGSTRDQNANPLGNLTKLMINQDLFLFIYIMIRVVKERSGGVQTINGEIDKQINL